MILLFVIGLILFVLLLMILLKKDGHRGLPGFPQYPLIGAVLSLQGDKLTQIMVARIRANQFRNMAFSVAGKTFLVTCDPRDVETILQTRFEDFVKGAEFNEVFKELLGNGIFSTDGEEWAMHRKAASRLFASGKCPSDGAVKSIVTRAYIL